MPQRLYDSATRAVRDLVPLREGEISIYVCGATPQGSPHVGHVRAQVAYDVLRRWLEHRGHRVLMVRNVTDIDDKILDRAAAAGAPWWAHAYAYEREFTAAYEALRVQPPTYEPRATGHVTEMLELVDRLLRRGHAYVAADGSGDVYFEVSTWADYGSLTHQRLDDLAPAADADPRGKRDSRDFALWKGSKADEPASASWPTPWGRGRPGWHLECSAMATRYLGSAFDLHGGGLDLRFPHHENEQAQSRAAGDAFASMWMHAGLLTQAGEKMSKSLGNTLLVQNLLRESDAVVVRYALVVSHYRSTIEFSMASLAEAATAYERVVSFLARAREHAPVEATEVPFAFAQAMDDDLGTPAAAAVLHEEVRRGNAAITAGDVAATADAAGSVLAMLVVLGLEPRAGEQVRRDSAVDGVVARLVEGQLAERARARHARDFARADSVRDALQAAGITVEDTPDGARWTYQRRT